MGYKFVFLVCFVLTTVEVTDSKEKCSEFEWQCPNGSCVSLIDVRSGADACADASDGSDEVKSPIVGVCELPPYPAHGKYVVYGDPKVKPGDMVTAAVLNITCDPGYENPGNDILICFEGVWASDLPKCVPKKDMCLLPAYPTHGSYVVSGMPTAVPGQALATVSLTYSCHPGYIIEGEDKRMCYQGIWSGNTVNCVESPSVSITLVIPQSKGKCSEFEWQCPDGSCVNLIDVRSGADACADGSNPGDTGDSREAAEVKCDNATQYRCADGSCVPAGARCDGARDCADGSDERADCGAKVKRNPTTLASLCKLPPYPPHGQYSVYGDPRMKPGDMVTAAVLNITCDPGYESLERDIVICFKGVWASDPHDCVPKNESCVLPPYPAHGSYVVAGLPDAAPGRALPTVALSVACDPGYRVKEDKEVMCYLGIWSGHVTDCEKSDSLSTTLEIKQSQGNCSASQYRCADGGCVPASARCDGARDCADGSDERADCGAKIKRNPITLASLCKLPPYPPHGQYSVYGDPRMKPGDVVTAAVLNITCDPGYESLERDIVVCFEGVWASDLPKCVETVKSCVLPPYPANGGYTVDGIPNAIPGDVLPGAVLNITCHPGYEIKGGRQRVCYRGIWCGNMADCEIPSYSCILPPYPAHGSYVVTGIPEAVPGQTLVSVHLNITCDPGYDIEGNKQRICYLGVWSGNISDCTASKELCELPPYPAHGSYAVTGLPNAVPGQALPSVVLDISCDPGYDIEGMKQIMCFGGIWSGDITDCVASKESCVLPPYPAHGSYAVTGLPNAVPGQALPSVVLDISCNPGYDIKGMKQRMCFGGIWAGDIPDCAVIVTNSCVLPPYPANGKYVVTGMPNAVPGQALDSVVLNVTCDSGYYIKGNKQLMCYRGKWSGNIADCEDVSDLCVLPPYPAHGTYSVVGKPDAVPGQVLDSVIITVTCDVGYHNLEKKYKMCYRGVWERIITDCVDSRNTCILPPLPAHGSYVVTGMPQAVPGQALDSVVLNITCNTGYGFEGDKQRMCYRGIWSENIKDCTALCSLDTRASVKFWCVNSFARPNELKWSRECNNYEPEGTVVKPQCKKNYFFPSALSRMRCVGGKWNYIARCIPEGGACVLPPKPANGSYVVTGLPYAVPGQASIFVTLIITCQEGYDTIGRKDRTCFDGIWSGGMPDCIPIENLCVLPKFPANGNYTVTSEPDAVPGQALDTAVLKVTCNSGFKNPGKSDITCYNGKWLEKIHDCVRDEIAARGRLAKRETEHHGG